MALLRRSDIINRYNAAQSSLVSENGEKSYSATKLKEISNSFEFFNVYDIFLSHSYDDARIVRQIYDMLKSRGYSVYVDWLEDYQLDREHVNSSTAYVIKNRMDYCRSLLYLTSKSARKSVWMPWELGYMDARTRRVAVAPILEEDETDFIGREYLGLYPYLDFTNDNFYIHSNPNTWINFDRWMAGEEPQKHE